MANQRLIVEKHLNDVSFQFVPSSPRVYIYHESAAHVVHDLLVHNDDEDVLVLTLDPWAPQKLFEAIQPIRDWDLERRAPYFELRSGTSRARMFQQRMPWDRNDKIKGQMPTQILLVNFPRYGMTEDIAAICASGAGDSLGLWWIHDPSLFKTFGLFLKTAEMY